VIVACVCLSTTTAQALPSRTPDVCRLVSSSQIAFVVGFAIRPAVRVATSPGASACKFRALHFQPGANVVVIATNKATSDAKELFSVGLLDEAGKSTKVDGPGKRNNYQFLPGPLPTATLLSVRRARGVKVMVSGVGITLDPARFTATSVAAFVMPKL
jgi:hypothetical protein